MAGLLERRCPRVGEVDRDDKPPILAAHRFPVPLRRLLRDRPVGGKVDLASRTLCDGKLQDTGAVTSGQFHPRG